MFVPGRELRPGVRMLLDPRRLGSLQGLFPGRLKNCDSQFRSPASSNVLRNTIGIR